jgi:hypothetical protein
MALIRVDARLLRGPKQNMRPEKQQQAGSIKNKLTPFLIAVVDDIRP